MKSRAFSAAVFWASLAILVAVIVTLGAMRWEADEEANVTSVGVRPTASLYATRSATPAPSSSAGPSQEPSPSPSLSETFTGPVEVAAPVRVVIPALDVNAKVLPVGLLPDGAMEIPKDIRNVGWYKLGVPPGVDRGSAVLVAHRDGREQGRGVFYWLGNLGVDDRITVLTSAGDKLPYRVVSRELIKKKRLPYEELFAVDGPPRLTLISCGGYYDRNNGGYQDNVVVTALPMFEPIPVPAADGSEPSSAAPVPQAAPAQPAPSAAPQAAAPAQVVAAPQAATVVTDEDVVNSVPVLLGGGSWTRRPE